MEFVQENECKTLTAISAVEMLLAHNAGIINFFYSIHLDLQI